MSDIGKRLGEESERVSGGVSALAATAGVARNTVYNWVEKGNIPADKLRALGDAGIDYVYVLTGELSAAALSPDERELLTLFRAAPLAVKAAAIGALQGGSTSSAVRIHGHVLGDSIVGNKIVKGRRK